MFWVMIALSAIVIHGEGQTIGASSASFTVVEPNSDFMLKLLLENPDNVGGSYLIVQKETLLEAIKDSLPSGFYYGKGKVRYDTVRTKIDLSGPIGNTMLLTDIIDKGIEISQGEIPIGPLTPLELYGYYTGKPTTPPEIAACIGETMIDNKRKNDAALFDSRMRNYGFYRDPSGTSISAAVYPWKIHDGIPIPPSTTLVLEIPIRAPADEGEYNVDLAIPYLYTTKQIPDVSVWDGCHIAQAKTALKIPIAVKEEKGTLPISYEELTSITWQFGRDDGSVISNNMYLNPDGTISGYYHPNEHRWEVKGNDLLFYHEDGRIATRFTTFKTENGKWVIQGPFLLPAEPYGYQTGHINHVLKQLS